VCPTITERTTPPEPERSFLDVLIGRPLSSEEERGERIGPAKGIPIFGLDALSSAAYGPEAALTILLALGALGIVYIVPISFAIIILLSIVYFSYRQTIAAYPGGGGSYTVASQNLGQGAGLLAGAALMVDYVLNVAVGISAGVGATVSALPSLQPHTLALCMGILAVLLLVNLRGVREAGAVFMLPTYLFIGSLGGVIAVGLYKAVVHGGHPPPVIAPPGVSSAVSAVSVWLLLRAFASGCTAMTGVEAVSNGVQAFREPVAKSARATLTTIIGLLILLLAGIAYLCRTYGIGATPPGQPGYQSVLSQLTAAVVGRSSFYYVTIGAVVSILALSANTSFADFPRLCHAIAEDGYLPYALSLRGRRLVYSFGIYTLTLFAGLLLVAFRGVTDRLIPLFAVGAFLAFTLSQAGMVMHWHRTNRRARTSMLVNGVGATATAITLVVIVLAKFVEGAWITVLVIPTLVATMYSVRRHYNAIRRSTTDTKPADLKNLNPPLVVVPLQFWSRVGEKALRFAYTLSQQVYVLHIKPEGQDGHPGHERSMQHNDDLSFAWEQSVEIPAIHAGYPPPQLVILRSPYRLVLRPIVDYILELEREHPDRQIAVLVPELIESRWYYYLLHNQRSAALKLILDAKGTGRIIVINIPWYLGA
jgi:amino acid transporter